MTRVRHWTITVVLIAALLLATSCGHSRIFTDDPNARIYVNGKYLGKGEAEISTTGTPRSARILIKSTNGERTRKTVSRKFTATTFFLGVFSYMTGFYWAWQYPDTIYVRSAVRRGSNTGASSWDAPPSGTDWSAPPAGWQKKAQPKSESPPPPSDEATVPPKETTETQDPK